MKENSPNYIRASIEKAIASINYPDTRIIFREVFVNNETNAYSMCSALFGQQSKEQQSMEMITNNRLVDPSQKAPSKDHNDNPKITFLLDASEVQLGYMTNGTTNDSKQKPSIDFTHRYGVPTITTVSTSWAKHHVPSADRQWHITVKTLENVLTTGLVKDLLLEYGIRKVAILYDESFGRCQTISFTYFLTSDSPC